MFRNTEKLKSIHERFINFYNSTLERKIHENKMENLQKISQVLNFAVPEKICKFPGIYICGRPYQYLQKFIMLE